MGVKSTEKKKYQKSQLICCCFFAPRRCLIKSFYDEKSLPTDLVKKTKSKNTRKNKVMPSSSMQLAGSQIGKIDLKTFFSSSVPFSKNDDRDIASLPLLFGCCCCCLSVLLIKYTLIAPPSVYLFVCLLCFLKMRLDFTNKVCPPACLPRQTKLFFVAVRQFVVVSSSRITWEFKKQ